MTASQARCLLEELALLEQEEFLQVRAKKEC